VIPAGGLQSLVGPPFPDTEEQSEGHLMSNRPTYLRIFFVVTGFGVLSLLAMLSRPSLAEIRGVDIVHLIGTGMCFGVGLMALMAHFRGGHLP